MGRAVFVANDPRNRTVGHLENLIAELRGVTDWTLGPDGVVTIEYDDEMIGVATIEEALAGLGFRVEHVADDPEAGDVTR
ncbi:MAG: hypothetical protein M5U01_31245 [Ardenticatenaceae bacterium]|nr:hypothetical protein [Ardenticatenaceae bacterium]HBY97839.1 hypothetical protein [Chloroflexota bacterium]